MRRFVLIVMLVAAMVAGASGAAGAAEEFKMYGGGWGHSLGFSQYGGLGLAQKGWSRDAILGRFYTGAAVAAMPSPPSVVRVGLIQGFASTRVKAVGGNVEVKFGGTGQPTAVSIPSGQTWTLAVCSGKFCVKRPDGTTAVSGGSTASHLFLTYQSLGNSVYLYGTNHTYDRGWMEVNLYAPCSGCALDLRVINVVGPQGYLFGLAEVPNSWPANVLQAQAVAGRTYAFYKIRTGGQNRAGCNCAVYATTLDQVYIGADKVNSTDGARWQDAVEATDNLVLLKGGVPIGAFYHASSGGHTEHNENVWGGTPLDYLRGRCDPGDYTTSNPYRTWTTTLSGATIGNLLASYTGVDIGDATGFTNIERGVSGHIVETTVTGTSRSVTVSGSTLRSALGLRNAKVWINGDKNVTGNVRKEYDNRMCAPGLPTSVSINVTGGRYQTFQTGRIYANYELDDGFWIHGDILDKYLSKGGHGGFLGIPRSRHEAVGTTGGLRAIFEGGRIYWKSTIGAHEIHGRILTTFLNQGGTGKFGFPTSDVVTLPNGQLQSTFERGTITCPNSSTGSCTTVVN